MLTQRYRTADEVGGGRPDVGAELPADVDDAQTPLSKSTSSSTGAAVGKV